MATTPSFGGSGSLPETDGGLLFVATDRISAFDHILPTGIPCKGRVLTQLSIFWFDFLRDLLPNHFVTAEARGARTRRR